MKKVKDAQEVINEEAEKTRLIIKYSTSLKKSSRFTSQLYNMEQNLFAKAHIILKWLHEFTYRLNIKNTVGCRPLI